ncbi:MAG: hypothetical protein ABR502_07320 [Chitinophagaceae bacterium]
MRKLKTLLWGQQIKLEDQIETLELVRDNHKLSIENRRAIEDAIECLEMAKLNLDDILRSQTEKKYLVIR